MSKSKPTAIDKLYYGIKYTAEIANKLTNAVPPQVLSDRWRTIVHTIELVAKEGDFTAVMPFHLRASEVGKLEKIGYGVNGDTINWEIDLFTDQDMEDAFN
jgi:hypothetical protein